jgi:hypothetical protein
MKIISAVLSLLGLGAGGVPPTSHRSVSPPVLSAPPEVTSESEEGFHDLILFIVDHARLDGGEHSLRAAGVHGRERLAIEVVLGNAWRQVSFGGGITGWQGKVTYRSIGRESDALLRVLDELYGTKLKPPAMARTISFSGISLGGDPRDLAKAPLHMKLFYEAAGDDYAELYTNIDIATRRLEIHEKDEGYRSAIVRALRLK